MARAFLRKGTEDNEVTYKDRRDGNWLEQKRLYRIFDEHYHWEDSDSRYFTEDGSWVDVWWDDSSGELVDEDYVVPGGGPEWVCGVCDAGFFKEEEAAACCPREAI